jgi:hypothetical protein
MAVSGTTNFNMDLTEIVEEAFERAGSELRTGYDLRTARRSLNLLFTEWANRGINMWTIEEGQIALTPGVGAYDLPSGTVDLIEHVVRTNNAQAATQADLAVSRISVSTYATIPNKLLTGRPIQIYIDRVSPIPTANLWPVPDTSQTYTLVYWRLRRIQDAGTGVNTMDVPFRFLNCMVAGLAYMLAMKLPDGINRIQLLKEQYDAAWELAAAEDRDKSSVRFVPRYMAPL